MYEFSSITVWMNKLIMKKYYRKVPEFEQTYHENMVGETIRRLKKMGKFEHIFISENNLCSTGSFA